MNFILLAAGLGKRMGENKALMNVHGRPWVLAQLQQITEAGLQKIILVIHPDSAATLKKILSQFCPELLPSVVVLTNPHPEKGPFSSLQLAITAASEEASFISPIDVPLTSTTLKTLQQSWPQAEKENCQALISSYRERKGHPVILSRQLQKTLLALSPEDPQARLDFILQALPENRKKILDLQDPHILKNFNTPEDLNEIL